ncbi:MAG TPA: S4 domain-containing protein [Pyrinomonadaceae bacterium]|nr:S4 domain-containing protein [Pyrinomonadaceae bacterium]
MRLDLFLKLSRLCPRRTVAQKLCDAGFVSLNDREAKSAHSVKVGDRITLKRRDMQTEFRVLSVPDTRNVAKRDAHDLVELISRKEFEPWG